MNDEELREAVMAKICEEAGIPYDPTLDVYTHTDDCELCGSHSYVELWKSGAGTVATLETTLESILGL